jgi:hypothetical protein
VYVVARAGNVPETKIASKRVWMVRVFMVLVPIGIRSDFA